MPVILRIERPHGVALEDRVVVVQAAADIRKPEQQVGHGKTILDTGRISPSRAGLGELGAKGEVAVGASHRGGIRILNLGKVAAEVQSVLSLDQGEIIIEADVVVSVVADTISHKLRVDFRKGELRQELLGCRGDRWHVQAQEGGGIVVLSNVTVREAILEAGE